MSHPRRSAPPLPSERATRRVALITREYQPLMTVDDAPDTPRGGIARAMSMHAHALAAAGVEQVHVITLSPDGEPRSFRDRDVFVHRIPEPRIVTPPDMPYAMLGIWSHCVAAKYSELDTQVGFDVVEAPDWHGEVLHLNRRPETSLVVSLHCLSAVIASEQERGWSPGERAWDALELLALARADHLIAPTQRILDASRQLLGDRFPPSTLIPLPFDAGRFPARERPLCEPDSLTLTFVGRIERLKGPDLAMRVADAVRSRGLPVTLHVLGRPNGPFADNVVGPLHASLPSLQVEWAGELSESAVADRLRRSDCAILPSRFENFHMAAIEALSSGVPVITTDRSGLTSWFGRDDGFLALPLDDEDAYVQAAADALTDDDWLARSGAVGADRVRRLLDPAVVAAQVLETYNRVRQGRGSAMEPSRVTSALPGGQSPRATLHDRALRAVEEARWSDARALAIRGLQSDGSVERLNDVAVMLAETGDLTGARALLTACVVIQPDDGEALANLEAIDQMPATILAGSS